MAEVIPSPVTPAPRRPLADVARALEVPPIVRIRFLAPPLAAQESAVPRPAARAAVALNPFAVLMAPARPAVAVRAVCMSSTADLMGDE